MRRHPDTVSGPWAPGRAQQAPTSGRCFPSRRMWRRWPPCGPSVATWPAVGRPHAPPGIMGFAPASLQLERQDTSPPARRGLPGPGRTTPHGAPGRLPRAGSPPV